MPLPWATRTTLPEPLRDLRFSLWIVRNNRPLTIGEHDRELRDIFEYIFQADDIWSEGGIAIFGILAYWITKSFEYKEKLLSAIPFGDVRHNALELELATKRACADFGIGSFEEGRLTYNLKADTPMKHNGNFVQITSLEVQEARELLRKDIIRRFYTELSECKLEDFAVATFVDPRYKALDFRGLEEWQRGELTAHQVIEWARQAYDADWKPKAATSQPVDAPQVSAPRLKVSNLVSFLDEEEDDEAAIVQEEVEFVGRESEFTLYLSMPPAEKSLDPLHWWGDREEKLPNLSRMARQFLAPPASTAGVERMFSACGQLHSDLKNKCLRDDPATLHDGIH
ncbi:hypothetical protein CYMTET_16029 [Cymbomonas tetramitiformis]|uniref:HAT C-terminal dimerisation domain-containing protein n=1 Tax=Cymbomonas tetramitiformis TaxID=36881 RepID=A0AAE0GDD0_9CHLO|nr:hypothetical protein CYMTET_16029 [Cymbomonas tetramitiformis]